MRIIRIAFRNARIASPVREGDTVKLLIFGIDAADPKILFDYLEEFPTISKLAREGSYGKLQGYSFGYGSYDNWATIFTGLPPREHGVIRKSGNSPECPTIDDIEPHDPIWHALNRNGVTTAFVRGMMMNPPPEMDGWAMGGDPEFLDKTASTRYPVFCDKDAHLADLITGEFLKPFRAPYLEELGGDWDEVRADPTAIGRVMHADYFAPFLEYVQAEADYYVEATLRLQREQPTDLLFFFLNSMDILQHFQMHEKGFDTVRRGYRIVDDTLGVLMRELAPENVLVMSDHGQEPFHMLFPDTPIEVQKEAFGWPVRAWRDDGTILCKGTSGVLSASHATNGVLVCSGPEFAQDAPIGGYRVLDIYPTLLQFFGVACDRPGEIIPVFRDAAKNAPKKTPEPEFRRIAVVQTMEVNKTIATLNELWIRYRGAHITVVGHERFRNTFLYDPRVDDFLELEGRCVEWESFRPERAGELRKQLEGFDLVVIPLRDGDKITELWL